jgi:hypothetical protein
VPDLCGKIGVGAEQVRRRSREGKIPGRIPGIKPHHFQKDVIDTWLKSGGGHGTIISNALVVPEVYESVLPEEPLTYYHNLGVPPATVIVTATDKGVLGPPPVVGRITASSYTLTSLVCSGQIVNHIPVLAAPGGPSGPILSNQASVKS